MKSKSRFLKVVFVLLVIAIVITSVGCTKQPTDPVASLTTTTAVTGGATTLFKPEIISTTTISRDNATTTASGEQVLEWVEDNDASTTSRSLINTGVTKETTVTTTRFTGNVTTASMAVAISTTTATAHTPLTTAPPIDDEGYGPIVKP